jgi:predicted transcriptional regulator
MESILLSLARGSQLKTHIAYQSKLDSRTISRYLPLLIELGLIRKTSSDLFKITEKGYAFLKDYAKVKKYKI